MPAHPHHDRPAIRTGEERRSPVLKWLFAPLRLAYKLWFGLLFWLSLLVLYVPFKLLLRRPKGYRAAFRLKRVWGAFLHWAGLFPQQPQKHRLQNIFGIGGVPRNAVRRPEDHSVMGVKNVFQWVADWRIPFLLSMCQLEQLAASRIYLPA